MKLSTKGRYGLRAMVDLAVTCEEGPVPIQAIAKRQDLSEKYLEQLLGMLKKAGLVKSIRVNQGGYQIAGDTADISVGDILRALEGELLPVDCVGFEDETNSTKVVDPGYAWIIPTGADSKPVKIAFEGDTLVDEEHNRADWSREIHVYKKVGVVAMLANNICAYCDTSLVGQMNDWFLNGVTGNVMTYDGRASK